MKFGFWRPTDQCCYKIWNGTLKRSEAVKIVNELQYKFPKEYFQDWIDFHAITKDEFWRIAEKWRNKNIWTKKSGEWRLKNKLI